MTTIFETGTIRCDSCGMRRSKETSDETKGSYVCESHVSGGRKATSRCIGCFFCIVPGRERTIVRVVASGVPVVLVPVDDGTRDDEAHSCRAGYQRGSLMRHGRLRTHPAILRHHMP